jgi:hypothetical protein
MIVLLWILQDDALGDKDPAKWKHAAYRRIEKGAADGERGPKVRLEMIRWEIQSLRRVPAYATVTISKGTQALSSIVAEMETQTSLPFDRQGFDRVPVLDALERVIGTQICDFTSSRGKIQVTPFSRTHSWRFGFGHTSVRMGSLRWERVNRFGGGVQESVSTNLSFMADPRLEVAGAGQPVVLEAEDDTGKALEPLPRDEESRWINVRFKPPGETATKLAKLTGYIPYFIATKSEKIALASGEGSVERGGTTIRVKPEKGSRIRVEASPKDPSAPVLFPAKLALVGKEPGQRVEGEWTPRGYSTSQTSWIFQFAKPEFEPASIELEWPVETMELRAWFEFTDLPLR